MTTAIVLKPDFGGTFSFGALRVAGTFVGLLLATLLAHLAMDGASIRLVLLTLFCLGFRLLTQVNYGIGVAFLTGMLVLLLSFEGVSPGAAVGARLQATVAGSALALIAYALWPTRERRQIRTSLAHLLSAYRDYLRRLLLGQMDNLGDTRAAARVARTNAQASIERLRGEPRSRRNLQELKLAESLLANGNRLIRATLLLEAVLSDGHPLPTLEALPAFAQQADQTLSELIDCLRTAALRLRPPCAMPSVSFPMRWPHCPTVRQPPPRSPRPSTASPTASAHSPICCALPCPARPAWAEVPALHDGAHDAGG